jgi:uncharacterized protein (TIGR02996 family)
MAWARSQHVRNQEARASPNTGTSATMSAKKPPASLALAESLVLTEPARALEVLLAVYRSTWHPQVAQVIERLGAHVGAPVEGLPVKQSERGAALSSLVLASTPADRSPLLQATTNFAASAMGQKVWPCLEAWAEVQPDPRIAATAFALLSVEGRVRDMTAKVFRRLLTNLERHGHVGMLPAFDAWRLHARTPSWRIDPRRLANLGVKLAKREPAAVDDGVLARLLAHIPAPLVPSSAPHSDVAPEALLDAVVASPDDDTPRLMFADYLTERSDPRGEFIALQCARAAGRVSDEARRREAELFQQHRTAFLGPFDKRVALSGLRFDRGFLVRASLRADLPRHPLVRLLEDVEFGRATAPRELSLDRLHTARSLALEVLGEVMARAPRLEEATTTLWTRGPEWTITRELLARLPRPLTRLGLRLWREGEPLSFVLRQAFALAPLKRLERFELDFPTGVPSRQALEHAPATLQSLRLGLVRPRLSLSLIKEQWWSRATIDGHYAFEGAGEMFDQLIALGVTSLAVSMSRHALTALKAVRAQLESRPQLNGTLTER